MLRLHLVSACLAAALLVLPAADAEAKISCNTGKRILEGKNYINVKPRDCYGEIYAYTGIRYGKNYWIEVRRRDGKVLDAYRR